MRASLLSLALLAAGPLAAQVSAERVGGPDTNPPASAADLSPNPAARLAVLGGLPTQGALLVVESTNRRVLALNPQTGDIIDANFVPADGLNLTTPIEATLHPDGQRILLSDQIRDVVQSYDATTGAFLGTYAPAGGVNTAILDNIRGIELRPNGNLLVSQARGTIQEFSTTGAHIAPFISAGTGGLVDSFDVSRVGQSAAPLVAGDFLVADITLDDVLRFSATGAALPPVVTEALNFPQQISQAANGNVLVAVFSGLAGVEGVVEFTPAGVFVARYDPGTLSGYRGVAELGNGNILTTTGTGIHEISRANTLVRTVLANVSGRFIQRVVGGGGGGGGDLQIAKVAQSGQVGFANNGTFLLTASNAGPGTVSNVVVSDALSSGLGFVSSTCNGTATAGGVFTWTVGTLSAGQSATCTLRVQPRFGGTFSNVASISGTGDTTPNNNVSAVALLSAEVVPVPAGNVWTWGLLAGLLAFGAWFSQRR